MQNQASGASVVARRPASSSAPTNASRSPSSRYWRKIEWNTTDATPVAGRSSVALTIPARVQAGARTDREQPQGQPLPRHQEEAAEQCRRPSDLVRLHGPCDECREPTRMPLDGRAEDRPRGIPVGTAAD